MNIKNIDFRQPSISIIPRSNVWGKSHVFDQGFLWVSYKHFSLQPFFSYKALVTALQFIPVDYLDLLPLDYAAVVNVKTYRDSARICLNIFLAPPKNRGNEIDVPFDQQSNRAFRLVLTNLTTPVTVAKDERTFSKLIKLKTVKTLCRARTIGTSG